MRTFLKVRGERVEEVAGEVVREQPLTVYVNEARFSSCYATPRSSRRRRRYLWMEMVIADVGETAALDVSPVDGRVT